MARGAVTLRHMSSTPIEILKRGIPVFWAVWFTFVVTTNTLDLLRTLGALPETSRFASGNFALIETTTHLSRGPSLLLFVGVILWEGTAALLFWRCATRTKDPIAHLQRENLAFCVSLGLWAAFTLTDEILLQYSLAEVHLRIFSAQLLSLLAIHLLPSRESD